MAVAQCVPDPPAPGGTVTCSGSDNDGFIAPANTPVTINVQSGASVNAAGNGNSITFAPNTLGNVLNLSGSLNAGVAGSGTGSITIVNMGNFNGGVTITGTGTNSLTLAPGRNINGAVNISGAQNTIESDANFNQGLVLSGSTANTVTNRGQINQTFSITGNGQNVVGNTGTINNGIALSGNGVNFVTNAASATINQNIVSTGTANNTIDNAGLVNNNITLGSGNDIVINRVGASVNFNLDDPLKNVANGAINMGDGANQFFMFGGTVNNQVLQGSGDDMATISGGTITQFVSTGGGQDQLLWTGGTIGALNMGTGNDLATLRGLTPANVGNIPIDGGLGSDRLILDSASAAGVPRFLNWETIELINGAQLTFNSTLTLGDSGTGTGSLSIDPASTIFAGQGSHAIVPFTPGLLVTVTNAGTIDLTNGAAAATDNLTIVGNYIGQGGRLLLHTVLESDGASSDRLIIDSGQATGVTGILVSNLNGAGAQTQANGILVVDAINGATTQSGAFTLLNPGGYAAAGPYAYTLFRGSIDAGNPNAWYLRSTVDCSADPTNPACGVAPPDPEPEPGPGPGPDPPLPGPPRRPNYRPEVSLYAAIPSLALLYGRTLLDTLHQRVGEQEHLRGRRDLGTSTTNNGQWGRVIALRGGRDGDRLGVYGDGPAYDLSFAAVQVGQDIYRAEQPGGVRDHVGVLGAIGHGRGDVDHIRRIKAGRDSFMAYTGGGYWTRFGPSGWYVDNVLQGTWYDVEAVSGRLPDMEVQGGGVAASLETGYPIRLGGGWMIEPQAQAVYQLVGLGKGNDTAATVKFHSVESLAGRLGARVANTWMMNGALVTAWVRPNLWREFEGDPKTAFSSATGFIPFRSQISGSWAEFNGGLSAQVTRSTSIFANASYQVGLDGRSEAWDAKIGGRINW